ncbi:hypothetical protein [Gandjariella thermophila]|uniref:Uncharacterized protein n=1 Tax=Gandjariella thermophila TaxID=1931992 RepID=A0A4D4J987_9PSEU|nr:hypothetical protein [Gandjariella thermophila]GDY33231.1 hypothetical protein GTS_48640 [Gandjariella thermophila]
MIRPEDLLPLPEALTRWPVLRRLADLTAGWTFAYAEQDGVAEWTALRTWPDGTADILRLRGETDAESLRVDPDGYIVWKADGTAADVVDKLTALLPPGHPLAPRLALGRAPDPASTARLWWPR